MTATAATNVIDRALQNARDYDPDIAPEVIVDPETGEETRKERLPVFCTSEVTETTLGDLGQQLVHGHVVEGVAHRDFVLRRLDAALELEVGALRAAPESRNHIGRLLTATVCTVTESICGVTTGKASPQAMALVNSLPAADVMHILITRGAAKNRGRLPIPPLDEACPHCGQVLVSMARPPVSVVPVWVHDGWAPGAQPTASVRFVDPPPFKGSAVRAVAMQRAPWGAIYGQAAKEMEIRNVALLRQRTIEASVVGYELESGERHTGTLPATVLRSLMAWDIDAAYAAAVATWGGLLGHAPVTHTCGNTVNVPFDWTAALS